LQHIADLDSITWTDLGDPVIGTGEILTLSDAITSSRQRFYRVVVVESP
jgi:hypothetical protein